MEEEEKDKETSTKGDDKYTKQCEKKQDHNRMWKHTDNNGNRDKIERQYHCGREQVWNPKKQQNMDQEVQITDKFKALELDQQNEKKDKDM